MVMKMEKIKTPKVKTLEGYLREPYSRILIPDEGGGYTAEILEFPGCYAEGNTAEEALRNLDEAAKGWIEAALAQGQQIPAPIDNHGYAGKVALRLPRSLHKEAARMAELDKVSLNQFLLSAIAARVGAEDLYNRMAQKLEGRWITQTTIGTLQVAQSLLQAIIEDYSIKQIDKTASNSTNLIAGSYTKATGTVEVKR